MKLRALAIVASAFLASSVLTGCTESAVTATPTPVDFKACLVSSPAGFNDGALNQDAYYGLLQAEAQYGVSTSEIELAPGASSYQTFRAARKLVARDCNIVFTIGGFRHQLATLANGNPKVQFVELEAAALGTSAQPIQNHNLTDVNYDTRVAFLEAGYLAASKSTTGKVAVLGLAGDSLGQSEIWYFRQGVYQFAERSGHLIQILGAQQAEPSTWKLFASEPNLEALKTRTRQLIGNGADVLLPIGVNGLVVAQVAQTSGKLVIGSGSDWAKSARYASVKSSILASVAKPYAQLVVDQIAQAVGAVSPAPQQTSGSQLELSLLASLTPEGAVTYGGISETLAQLGSDYLAGKTSVVEPSIVK